MDGLYGLGKIRIPVIALAVGGVLKLILNIVLISNPKINIYGATISSIVCQSVAFAICWTALNKYIKINVNFKNHILKPIVSAVIMGALSYGTYLFVHHFAGNTIATLAAILVGAAAYTAAILVSKCLTKEEIHMIPYGSKLYGILTRVKLYE